ncbi:hypothetical protein [Paracoccus zeaxanthinifaciens]|nr:hypothetical protein [Paracoccus zeaxanthinifaciens]
MVTIGWPYAVNAQSSESGANSSSSSSTDVESAASANASGGNSNAQIYLDQRGPSSLSTQHSYSGKYTVRSAPSVQPPSMGSGHPCALGGSIGISLIGGGAAAGLNRVDDACLLAQMGQGQAALIMIARRDEEACKALRQVGTIPATSQCSRSERVRRTNSLAAASRAAPTPAPAAAQTVSIARYVSCSRRADDRIVARKRSGAPFSDEQVAAFCRTQLAR